MRAAQGQNSPVVHLPAGRLRGATEGGVAAFRRVPYAAPPTGGLRWRPAQPYAGWSGVRDATTDGPSAPQSYTEGGDPVLGGHGSPPFDDDCLTLNVWTPSADDAGRPVLVWIHGGGFVSGSGSLPNYSGEAFARNGDLVVVSVNYRIGPLGYLYFGADGTDGADSADGASGGDSRAGDEGAAEPGNFWLTDQIAALRWVHDHIAHFGGDPDRITVAGQSGGAVSTAALAGHPEAQGLFRRAILQSPPLGLHIPTPAEYLPRTAAYLRLAGVRDVDGLRALPWPRLIEAAQGLFGQTRRWGYWPTPFLPVRDGVTLRRHPARTLLHDAAADIDVMIGWTREEATFGFALDEGYAAATRGQVLERIAETFPDRADEVYGTYEEVRAGARPVDVLMGLISDELFRAPCVELAEARAELGRPVWAYQFDFPTPALQGRLAATHCLELPFVFGDFARWSHAPFLSGIDPAVRTGLGHAMHQAWIAFVRTGDPNHPDLPGWERYAAPARTTMRFDAVTAADGDPAGVARRLHHRASR
ncbi:carboxylesterase family protein [Streptomyces sp. E11-3]|uniref:carboxylesterase/lipase family protein n=1 Tax=Streptomyces sp. E11-3 TaxID=3110112 RepID=UPI00397ECEB4